MLELVEYGDLKHVLKKLSRLGLMLTRTEAVAFVAQIAAGMQHIAERGVLHRDLALRNCLLGG